MTKEKAIEIIEFKLGRGKEAERFGLHNYGVSSWIGKVSEEREAFEMAILALSENKRDLISRQTAINAIANTCFWLSGDDWNELLECINSIPSVEKKGHWIDCGQVHHHHSFNMYKCSVCHEEVYEQPMNIKYHNFCLHCGADMRGE